MRKCKLTFICPSYNHEKYVLTFLNSLLNQTCPNWELLIFDDCSSDKTAEIIKSVKDGRIHFIQNPYNSGINASINKGIELCKSEILCLVASDDVVDCKYVETILKTFDENADISACYTPLTQINEKGRNLNKIMPLPIDKTQEEILAEMFINANLLYSPGMAFKKSVIYSFLPLDLGLLQYHDWQINFFLLYAGKIKLLETPLIRYRISNESACSRSIPAIVREEIETKKLMDTIVNLIGLNKEVFLKYFGEHPLIKDNNIPCETIPFWLGRLALTSLYSSKQKWGLVTIMNFISVRENVELLNKLYGFSYKDYVSYASLVHTNLIIQVKNIVKIILKKSKQKIKSIIN